MESSRLRGKFIAIKVRNMEIRGAGQRGENYGKTRYVNKPFVNNYTYLNIKIEKCYIDIYKRLIKAAYNLTTANI